VTVAPLLEVRDLEVRYTVGGAWQGRAVVRAVDGVSLALQRGETLGLVGESGCGKTSLAQALVLLRRPDAGRILLDGQDVTQLSGRALQQYRRTVQLVFQDPYSSLNPRLRVGTLLAEPIRAARLATGDEVDRRVARLLELVGLPPDARSRYPHEFSGGQRQRIGLARALSVEPSVVIADEPVSALDVSIQAQILNLLIDLQATLGLTLLFIAHDLAVVRHVSDRIGVMYLGQLVELAGADELYRAPRHPYTISLLSAVPVPDPDRELVRRRILLPGDAPSPFAPPTGCRFHTRCPFVRAERCPDEVPPLRQLSPGRWVACHYAEELERLRPSASTAPER
jgi:peptide/nickel transport system ATP-binding protein